jgi:hypothetical protein
MTISDTAAVYDNGSIRLHVDWETYFQGLDSFQSDYKEFEFQDNVILFQNGTSCGEYFQFCISPIVFELYLYYICIFILYSFVKGKAPIKAENIQNIQNISKVDRKKKRNKRSRTIKSVCSDNMFTPNTEKEVSTEIISVSMKDTFELENANIGWTLVTTKGPLQNSFSDYVKNASLTYI